MSKVTPVKSTVELAPKVILLLAATIFCGILAVEKALKVVSPVKVSTVTPEKSVVVTPLTDWVLTTSSSRCTSEPVFPAVSVSVTVTLSSPSLNFVPASFESTAIDQFPE